MFSNYTIIVAFFLAFLLIKYKNNSLYIFLILSLFYGLFYAIDKNIENIYKVFLTLFSVYLGIKYKILSNSVIKLPQLYTAFFIFSLSFFVSSIVNKDAASLILSQYFSKYFLTFITFLLFAKIFLVQPDKFKDLLKLFYDILIIQIILSIIKFTMFGLTEIIVGSLSSGGGALATTFPVFALIIYYFYKNGTFVLKDWLIIAGIFFIGFSSNKRALWFIMPVMIFLLLQYLPKLKRLSKLLILSPLILLIVYLGLRLTPTLNPDNQIWGTFNPDYAIEYAKDYSLGNDGLDDETISYGRVSSTFLLINRFKNGNLSYKDLIGYGQEIIRYTSYDEFSKYNTGLASKMATNGFYKSYLTTGLVGIITLLIWYYLMVSYIKNKRFKNILILYLIWEYFFYHGTPMDTPVAMILLTFIIWISRYYYEYNLRNLKFY